ncbi:E3 ubiquitin-protein ligase RNF170 [Drosophila hydei]|uniref:RING-type E3 ubiquitin transferase n=1 Tax=Drosophila hydei TaxID=7224 RepID=A0A6J2SSN3_DROHY|nr:E3 ubiquitin-protein ligase RNF170 [Drosophila hydei]
MNTSATNSSDSSNSDSDTEEDDSFDNRYYTCLVCMRTARLPRVTFCGHVFCTDCIGKWITWQGSFAKCPYCQSRVGSNTLITVSYGRNGHHAYGRFTRCKSIAQHRHFAETIAMYAAVPETSMYLGAYIERPPELMPRIKPLPEQLLRDVSKCQIRRTFVIAPIYQRLLIVVIIFYMYIVYLDADGAT